MHIFHLRMKSNASSLTTVHDDVRGNPPRDRGRSHESMSIASRVVQPLRRTLLDSHQEAGASAHRFAAEIPSRANGRDRAGSLPVAELAAFDASGLLAI